MTATSYWNRSLRAGLTCLCVLPRHALRLYHDEVRIGPALDEFLSLPASAVPSKGKIMILITGASGMVGRAVLEEVRKTKQAVKAMYRNAEDAKKAPAGVASVLADFADGQSMRKALEGVETVFLVCSPIPQLVELESKAIDASKGSGVRHIVLNSALGAGDYNKSFPSWHRKVEDKL